MLNLFWCFHSFPVLFWKSLHVERSLLLFPPFLLLLLLRWFSSPVPGSFPTHTCGYKAGLPSFCYLFFCWGVFVAVWFLVFWPSFFIFASWFLDFSLFVCFYLLWVFSVWFLTLDWLKRLRIIIITFTCLWIPYHKCAHAHLHTFLKQQFTF